MKIAIITIFPVLLTVMVIGFLSWKARKRFISDVNRYDYGQQPDDMPKWEPMNPVARMANRELKRMYRGNQLM